MRAVGSVAAGGSGIEQGLALSDRSDPRQEAQAAAAHDGSDIRYLCLSDLHFGAENSILTNLLPGKVRVDPHRPSSVMVGLVDCLRELVKHNLGPRKPTLILNGDILELALADDNIAAMVFEHFIRLVFDEGDPLFDATVLYVPGNHDHHLWEGARELQYAVYVRQRPLHRDLEIPWHATRIFTEGDPEPVHSALLNALIQRVLSASRVKVRTVYPNLAVGDGRRCVVVHHGHYLESIYRLMTELKSFAFPERPEPQTIWEIEAENFAWIDFFWSTLGRSGDVGVDVGLVYASFQSDVSMNRIAVNVAKGIGDRITSPVPIRWVERFAIRAALKRLVRRVGRLERSQPQSALSPPAEQELLSYLEGPVRLQLLAERHALPERLTFIFGHTHKPFEWRQPTRSYGGHVDVLNTGGWVVDTLRPARLQGGAIVLLSEDLEAVSLRMYQQTETGEPSRVRLQVANQAEAPGPFLERLRDLVDPAQKPWSDFSDAAATLVRERHEDLATILNLPGGSPDR